MTPDQTRKAAMEGVMTGGNHLASALIGLGIMPAEHREHSYDEILRDYGQPAADIFICWKKIMDARNDLTQSPEEVTVEELETTMMSPYRTADRVVYNAIALQILKAYPNGLRIVKETK